MFDISTSLLNYLSTLKSSLVEGQAILSGTFCLNAFSRRNQYDVICIYASSLEYMNMKIIVSLHFISFCRIKHFCTIRLNLTYFLMIDPCFSKLEGVPGGTPVPGTLFQLFE